MTKRTSTAEYVGVGTVDPRRDFECRIEGCSASPLDQLKFALCGTHAMEFARDMQGLMGLRTEADIPTAISRPARQRVVMPNGFVYYVRLGQLVKIGFSTNVEQRLKSFRTTHADIALLATEAGTARTERRRHAAFDAYRVRGELFTLGPELAAHISRLIDLSA